MERRTELGATVAPQETVPDRRDSDPKATEAKPNRERIPSGSKPAPGEPVGRRGGKRRRITKDNEATGTIRYFLTKVTSNGTPELDQEMPDEHQALLAAHKADRSFVTVEEWKAKPDRRKGITVPGKEPVPRQ